VSEQELVAEEIWVTTVEGAELTGYHPDYVRKLARDNWKLPEEERSIKTIKRSNRYDVWFPDLVSYLTEPKRGPHPKRK
jgi:hypothetical protein